MAGNAFQEFIAELSALDDLPTQAPAQQQQPQAAELMMEFTATHKASYLILCNVSDARKVRPSAGTKFAFAFINRSSLEEFVHECEDELAHRDFRYKSEGRFQTNADGRLVAATYEFDVSSETFLLEIKYLMNYFSRKYP